MAGPNQTKTSAPPWYNDRKAKTSGPEQQKKPTTASQVGMMLHSLTVNRSLIYMKGSICGKMGRILLDSGASVNCVSSKWARDNKLTLMNLAKTAEVRMADGTTYQGRMQVKDAAIKIGKYQGKATFIELPLPDIDVILGMPWLKQVNPSINWITARVATRDGCILHRGKSGKQARRESCVNSVMSLNYPAFDKALQECGEASNASPKHVTRMRQLLESFKDIFPEELPVGLPPQRRLDHRIILKPGTAPISRKQYRIPLNYLPEFKRQIDEQLKGGRIRRSNSPYSAPVLLINRNNKIRMCLDLRGLNDATVKDSTSLPNQQELFDVVGGCFWLTRLDLRSGFNQVRIHPEDIEKTAFNTPWGHFECTAMPFGLTNAPATFQALMQEVLQERLYKGVVVFVDDFLIYSKTEEEHLEMVQWVFEQLRKHKLYGAVDKCVFMRNEVDILGHKINAEGITTQTSKIKAIQEWPAPTVVKQLQSFLGLTNYYRNFVAGFSRIAAPLYALVEKKKRWEWSTVEQKAFTDLKDALSSTPTLALPDPNQPYVIHTDASQIAIGAVLSQQKPNGLQPIAFMSHKLNSAERNYPTHEQELLAIVRAAQDWRYYLLGSPHETVVYTDHNSLKHFLTQANLSKRQIRWMELLGDYKLMITYQSGTQNTVADALSRRSDYDGPSEELEESPFAPVTQQDGSLVSTGIPTVVNHLALLGISAVSASSLVEEIRTATALDSECQVMVADPPQYGLIFSNGLLYQHKDCIYVPNNRELRSKILHEVHSAPTGGHLGVAKTQARLCRYFYWQGQRQEVQQFIESCVPCCSNKASTQAPAGLLQPLEIPKRRWDHVSLDFIGPLPETLQSKHDMLLVVVDKLSKMVHLLPCKSSITAVQTAQLFFREIVRHHGVPAAVISDRDPRFTSHFWQELWKLLGSKLRMSTAFHPQSDGQTERMNRTAEEILRSVVNSHATDWDRHITAVEIAINSSQQSSTGLTPYYLNYGQEVNLPLDIATASLQQSQVPGAAEMLQQLNVDIEAARHNIQKAQQKQKEQADKHRRAVTYKIGDRVMLNNQNWLRSGRKLLPKYWGPFKVIAVPSTLTVTLELPNALSRIHNVFHVSKVKLYQDADMEFPGREQLDRPPPVVDEDQQFTIDQVIGKRIVYVRRGRGRRKVKQTEFLVLWVGYPIAEASWVKEEDINHPAAIIEFEERALNGNEDTADEVVEIDGDDDEEN